MALVVIEERRRSEEGLEAQLSQKQELLAEMDEQKQEMESLRQEKQELQNKEKELEEIISERKAKDSEKNREIEDLNLEKSDLKDKVDQLENDADEQTLQLRKVEEETVNLKEEVTSLKATFEEDKKRLAECNIQLENFRAGIGAVAKSGDKEDQIGQIGGHDIPGSGSITVNSSGAQIQDHTVIAGKGDSEHGDAGSVATQTGGGVGEIEGSQGVGFVSENTQDQTDVVTTNEEDHIIGADGNEDKTDEHESTFEQNNNETKSPDLVNHYGSTLVGNVDKNGDGIEQAYTKYDGEEQANNLQDELTNDSQYEQENDSQADQTVTS